MPRLMLVGPGALADLPASLEKTFDISDVLIVTGHDTSRAFGDRLADQLGLSGSRVEALHGPDGSIRSTETTARPYGRPYTLVVGFGGGRPIDVAKVIASRSGIDFVAVPTVLSHDGMCSPVASLTTIEGARESFGTRLPVGVVVDTSVIGRAPRRFLRAGIGDLVSNLTAIEDWQLAARVTETEAVDEFAVAIAHLSAHVAFDLGWPPSDDDLAMVARALVMSGLAMAVAGSSRPCSGGEHLVSHALDEMLGCRSSAHGEQVAIGVLVTAHLQGHDREQQIVELFERIGFPSDLEGWGLDPATLVAAIRRAPATRPTRYTILDEVDLDHPDLEAVVKSVFDRSPR